MNYKEEFISLFNKYIKRDGASELLKSLEKSDFFTAPASTRFHECYEGGLCEHSVKVFEFLKNETQTDFIADIETVAIVSLLHDVCKVGYYTTEMRNKKDENGKWIQVPFYTVEDKFPYGHGEKSVYLIEQHMKLSVEEVMAIRWHMGAYVGQQDWTTLSMAYNQYPLSLYLHMADMKATYLK